MVLREIVEHARARGIARLVGLYRPTERNGMVRDHYRKLGFTALDTTVEGDEWLLSTDCEIAAAPMTVRRVTAVAA
jgi:predicted enzyme involved in methoxymalonyl-ACP biosynthesis